MHQRRCRSSPSCSSKIEPEKVGFQDATIISRQSVRQMTGNTNYTITNTLRLSIYTSMNTLIDLKL
jgi:hypothetical protein